MEMETMIFMITLAFVIGTILGFAIGILAGIGAWERDAIKNGKGEYYLDENNNMQWRWK